MALYEETRFGMKFNRTKFRAARHPADGLSREPLVLQV